MLRKIIAGGPAHRTRLHDEEGNRLDLAGLRYLPLNLLQTGGRVIAGKRPAVPWIGYRAIKRLDALIQPNWTILEFGSGMSTTWYAERAERVVSIEHHAGWAARVRDLLAGRGTTNAEVLTRDSGTYLDIPEELLGKVDLIVNDGLRRDEVAERAPHWLKPRGYVYLDNSDGGVSQTRGDVPRAKHMLLSYAARAGSRPEQFVDLAPTYLYTTQGLLVQLP